MVGRVYGRKEARRRSETSRGIAIFRDGEKSEIKSVEKRGGGRKVGSTWSVNAHIIEREPLSNTLRRFFYVGAFPSPLPNNKGITL